MQIDKGRIVQEIVARLSKLKDGEGLLLQPYKKTDQYMLYGVVLAVEYSNVVLSGKSVCLK